MAQIPKKQKVTDVTSSSSDTRAKWRYPSTKREAIDIKEIGGRISMSEDLAGNIVNFLQTIGADNELPNDRKAQIHWLNHFHLQVAVNNPLWPEDLPFGYVYGGFVNAVIYDRVKLKGHNIHAFITAFKNWITQSGIEEQMYERYYRNNPDQKLKQIPEQSEQEYTNDDDLLDQSPEEVLRQVNTLTTIHGSFEDAIDAVANNGKTYREKLQRTFNYYTQKGHYE